jgi:hypothetical protein
MSVKKITITIFIITTASLAGLAFTFPILAAQPKNILIGICVIAGLVLSLVLSLVVYGLGKSPSGKTGEVKEKEEAKVPRPLEKAPLDDKVVQVLSIFQKKGRLIDFLQEDISGYEDGQIGAAVRNIHKGCREAITEYVTIEQVMNEEEGSTVTVKEGFDPSTIRLTGNVVGSPPFRGELRHSGWRVSSTDLPPLPQNQDLSIIEPAEVEIS